MTVKAMQTLEITRTFAATPEAVWDAWTRPEAMKSWSCPDPTAKLEVESDLRVGGAYALVMHLPDGVHTAHGVYREIEAPRRLVYTWDWKEDSHRMGETLVTVELEPADGGTLLRLTHEGFPGTESRDGHGEGWGACLARLEALVA